MTLFRPLKAPKVPEIIDIDKDSPIGGTPIPTRDCVLTVHGAPMLSHYAPHKHYQSTPKAPRAIPTAYD